MNTLTITENTSSYNPADIHKIAIFRALQLGDMLCSIPAIRAIRKTFPNAHITLIGLPWQKLFAQRFDHYFDDFVEFHGWPGLPELPYNIQDVMQFLHEMQQRQFDLVIQMQGNGYIVNPMCMLFGGKHVAGLRKAEDFLPEENLFAVMDEKDHEVTRFIKIVELLGGRPDGYHLEFPILPEERKNFRRMKLELQLRSKEYVCIHPGARDPRRRWNASNFARVGDALAARGFKVVITGSAEEKEVLDEVERCMHSPAINLVKEFGHVGIGELANLIEESAGLVSNDTGVSHVACALHVRSLIIFSKYSDPDRWAPLECNRHKAVRARESQNVLYVVNTALNHLDIKYETLTENETVV
jgi:ADP-heptose:LPS heptosyltransferase